MKDKDNFRDGLSYLYTGQDAIDYISDMLSADENDTFTFAITVDGKMTGSMAAFHRGI